MLLRPAPERVRRARLRVQALLPPALAAGRRKASLRPVPEVARTPLLEVLALPAGEPRLVPQHDGWRWRAAQCTLALQAVEWEQCAAGPVPQVA